MRTMSEFESRVREALGTGAEGAPPAVGLADAARRRLRRRRRVTSSVVAAAVVLAAVPIGVALLGDGDAGSGDDVEAAALPEVPDGYRWESWRDVQVAVPDAWTTGDVTQWCIAPDSGAGFVDRAEGASTQVLCEPQLGYGLVLRPGVAEHPLPDTRGPAQRLTLGSNTIDVIAPDQETLDVIVGSAHRFDDVDSRGCRTSVEEVGEGMLTGSGEGELTVCRYGTDGSAYVLAESRVLAGADAEAWLDLLAAAPEVDEMSQACDLGAEAVLVSAVDGPLAWLEYDGCGGGYVLTQDGEKAVSPELRQPLGSML